MSFFVLINCSIILFFTYYQISRIEHYPPNNPIPVIQVFNMKCKNTNYILTLKKYLIKKLNNQIKADVKQIIADKLARIAEVVRPVR